jgi:arylsulfatase A-like enzyme
MKRVTFSLIFLMTCFQLFANSPPNIILVLADDLGYGSLGCYGADYYETPNIDRIASGGMRFTNAYASAPVCAPSRVSLMSGQYTTRHKVLWVSHPQEKWLKRFGNIDKFKLIQPPHAKGLQKEHITLAKVFQNHGYATGAFGKWHMSNVNSLPPTSLGFDTYLEASSKHFGFKSHPPQTFSKDTYLSDAICDAALEFLDNCQRDQKPFFLYFPDFLVHKPLEAKGKDIAHFQAKTPGVHRKSPVAAAMHKALDDTVGRIVKKCEDLGVLDNTIFIFTSDNGGLEYKEDGLKKDNRSNHPLKSSKGSEWEGGIRVPLIVKWPGKIKAGSVNDTPCIGLDLYPTLCSMAGLILPDQTLDGMDLSPVLMGKQESLDERALFWYLPLYTFNNRPSVAIRKGSHKGIWLLEDNSMELYDLNSDLGEKNNIAASFPERCQEFLKDGEAFLAKTTAPRMKLNPSYNPDWRPSKKSKKK